jgi:hypothetical protein
VDADYYKLRILLFKAFELWDDMYAVDASIGPEVEQNKFTAKVHDVIFSIGIEPIKT